MPGRRPLPGRPRPAHNNSVVQEDFLETNLAALAKADPELAARVRAEPWPDGRAARAASGHWTLQVRGESGADLLLHSRVNPVAEARTQAGRVTVDGVAGFLVYGLGAGHLVAEILARAPLVSKIAVFEKELASLRVALTAHDWSDAIRTGRMILMADLSKPALIQKLDRYTLNFFSKTEAVSHPASQTAFPAYYAEMRRAVEEFFAYSRMNLHSLAELSKVTMMNICLNLSTYAFSPGMKGLAGAAKGWPAILVAGGPSLVKNIHLLNEAAKGAVLISVPTVFRTVLAGGVTPDFVTCLDYHKISAKYFEGLGDAPGVTLVCDPKVSYAVVDTYRGPKRFFDHPFLRDMLKDVVEEKGSIRWGATVAHLSLYLAEYLGADPIILVGQDLCYPYGITHMPGSNIHENWMPEFNRFTTFEMKEWETLMRIRPILRKARDIEGNPVYTDEQMFTYLVRFEEDFLKLKSRVIDATEGGLPKQGSSRMTLAEAIRAHCRNPFPRDRLGAPAGAPEPDDGLRVRVLACVRRWASDLEEAGRYYDEVLAILDRVHEKLSRGEEAASEIRAVREAARRIDGFMGAHRLVTWLAQPDEFRRVKADLEMQTSPASGVEKQKRELARDRAYLGGLSGACGILQGFMKLPVERLEGSGT